MSKNVKKCSEVTTLPFESIQCLFPVGRFPLGVSAVSQFCLGAEQRRPRMPNEWNWSIPLVQFGRGPKWWTQNGLSIPLYTIDIPFPDTQCFVIYLYILNITEDVVFKLNLYGNFECKLLNPRLYNSICKDQSTFRSVFVL